MIKIARFNNFTAFKEMVIKCSPGINILIGENGTGKTHILKSIYAACDITKSKKTFAEKINRVFLPSNNQIGRLVHRTSGSSSGFCEVSRDIEGENVKIRLGISNHTKSPDKAKISGAPKRWMANEIESVYIPVKEMLSNSPGFRSLYAMRDIHFEEVYADIIDRAFLSPLKGPTDNRRKRLLNILQKSLDGKVTRDNEEFFLRSNQGKIEFTLVAEGLRKLGLLWLLIQNGTLLNGSALFWDEPESNLNPKLMKTLIKILVELQKMGVQIFIATHHYVMLKEFDLQTGDEDEIIFHSLYRDQDTNDIAITSTQSYSDIHPNPISEAYSSLADKEISLAMGRLGK